MSPENIADTQEVLRPTTISDEIGYLVALKNGLIEIPPFLTRHLSVAIKSLVVPIQLSSSPEQMVLYSALKTPTEYMIAFGDEILSAVFLCANANPRQHPERIGIYFRKGLLCNIVISSCLGLLTLGVPSALKLFDVPSSIYQAAYDLRYSMAVNNILYVSYTYLIHFMNALDIDTFNILIQIINCGLEFVTIQMLLPHQAGYTAYISASIISNIICGISVLLFLGFNKSLNHYQLFNISNKDCANLHLKEILRIGLPRGVSSLITKAGAVVVAGSLSDNKQTLKAITTPEQYKKIFEILSKSFHKVFIKLAGIEYGASNIKNAISYYRIGQLLLPGFLCVALVIYLVFGKTFISSNTDVTTPGNQGVLSLAFNFLIMRGVLDIVQFSYEGSEIWFAASKNTIPAMLTAVLASVLTVGSTLIFRSGDVDSTTLYASQLIGAIPAAMLLFLWGVFDQKTTLKQGPKKLLTNYYPDAIQFDSKIVKDASVDCLLEEDDIGRCGYGSFA